MVDDRWSLHKGRLIHPDAVAQAKRLEQAGYTQHEHDELRDGEGVIVVAAHNGALAPARYFRAYRPGEHGKRQEHVLEAWPDSPFRSAIAYADTMHEPIPGKQMSRVGIFRLNAPEHTDDVARLYDERAKQHAEQAS